MSESMNEKIKKLLRLAERAGTEHEAESARLAAMRLMTKWGIEEAMLGDLAEKQEAIVTKFTAPFPMTLIKPRTAIAGNVVRGMGNMRIWISGQLVAVMGFESDVDRALAFIPSILIQADNECARWWKSYPGRSGMSAAEAKKAKRTFLFAFGAVVQTRLIEMRNEEIVESDKSSTKSTALVLLDRDKLVEQEFQDKIAGRLKKARPLKGSVHGAAASASGREAGQRARLGGQALGGSSRGVLGG